MCRSEPKYANAIAETSFRLVSNFHAPKKFLKQILTSLLSTITVHDKLIFSRITAMNATVNSTLSVYLVHLEVKLMEELTMSDITWYVNRFKHFKWRSNIELVKSNESFTIYTEDMDHFDASSSYTVRIVNTIGNQDILPRYMKIAKITTNVTEHTAICTDVVVTSVFDDPYLMIQRVTCLEKLSSASVQSSRIDPRSVITYIGCSVSVIALVISIYISRNIGISSSIPGNNLENLTIALGLSNLLFMLGIGAHDYQTLCYVIGVLLHYLWLVSFSFMSIAVSYMCRNLTKMVANTSHGNGDETNTKYVLTIFGLLVPICFVLPPVMLDYLEVSGFSASYAGLICFPTGYLINAIFVSGPITLSIVVNTVALVLIIFHVMRHNKETTHIRKSQSFQQGKVYLRICLFAGIFWITGIIGSVLRSDFIDFVFIILCSFQGLGVAVANLSTTRVLGAFKRASTTKYPETLDETISL